MQAYNTGSPPAPCVRACVCVKCFPLSLSLFLAKPIFCQQSFFVFGSPKTKNRTFRHTHLTQTSIS